MRSQKLPVIRHTCPLMRGMDAYQKIAEGPYLPDLKDNALELLSRRLSKIKTDECEQLVNKLKNELEEAGITESQKHYFLPGEKSAVKAGSAAGNRGYRLCHGILCRRKRSV